MTPTKEELAAAQDRTIPDVLPPEGGVLLCGINPSLYSAAVGRHFARPGNRFWPALHLSGWTERRLTAADQHLLPGYGLGISNVVARATARADELSRQELIDGGEILTGLVRRTRPGYLAVLGVTAYRQAFGRPDAAIGEQREERGGARVWVLPNPSGLNAHWSLERIAGELARLREAARPGSSRA